MPFLPFSCDHNTYHIRFRDTWLQREKEATRPFTFQAKAPEMAKNQYKSELLIRSHPRGREFESLQVHHQAEPKKISARKAQKFQRLPGFFAPIFRGVTKRCQLPCQANSMDLYLYPRRFEPLFREFFGRAALFRPRQSVEF